MPNRRSLCALTSVIALALVCLGVAPPAAQAQAPPPLAPQERLCDPAFQDCRADILRYIQQETVAIDMGFWFITDARYSNELVNAWNRGVKIRLLMDPRCAANHSSCVTQNDQLRAAGIPMRNRAVSGILHWKMILFVGQGQLEFAGANYSPFEMSPEIPFVNFTDEVVMFTNEPSLVQSFMTKFDDLWTSPTEFADYANITAPLLRSFPTYPIDPELNFPPGDSYRTRALAAYNAELQKIDVQMFRITDGTHASAMIAAVNRGVPVRVITDEGEYRNPARLWDSYNVDRMYQAGVRVRLDGHLGINHEKVVLLAGSALAIFGSSNWSDASSDIQREHNYFTTRPWISEWLNAQFERKWNNTTGYSETKPFVPLPPDAPSYNLPANAAAVVQVDGASLSWNAGSWAHNYDIYFGTAPEPPLLEANRNLGPGDNRTYALPALQPGTTYYWKIVSRTMAYVPAQGPVWSFKTTGEAPPVGPTPPAPTITRVRGPYLQQPTDRSMVIVWATREAGVAEVRYAAAAGSLIAPATSRLVLSAETAFGYDYYQHEASLIGLAAATTYSYQPFVAGVAVAPPSQFKTAPATGTGTVSFIAFGDSGTGSPEQAQLAAVMAQDRFDFALHAGDIAYAGLNGKGDASHTTYQSFLFDVYNWFSSTPFVPAEGNHDSRPSNQDGKAYLDLFALPTNGASVTHPEHAERYYSFDYGPVHVVALDTEFAFQDAARRQEQLRWLKADLSATQQPWKIAVYHRSPYSTGGEHGSDLVVRAAFGPLLERYGVDLVLTAHEHDYERTVPIKESVTTTDRAVTYVVTGGGGAPLYPSGASPWTAYSATRHQYVKVAVSGCTLTLNAIGLDGASFDNTTISHCTVPEPPPPAPSNVRPSVALTGPAEGATFGAPATIALTASAADSDGTVASVDFFAGATKLGTDTTAPYGFTWSNVAAGTYSLTAVAIDNAAGTTTSTAVSITVSTPPPSPPPPPATTVLPEGWSNLDIGATGATGSASFTGGVYSVRGAGADVWGTADAFHYAYRALDGDGSIVARVSSIQAVHAWTKAGVMIRNSLSPSAAQAFMLVASSAAKGVPFQRRLADGNTSVSSAGSQSTAPRWVKLTRVGNAIAGYESPDGTTWTLVGSSAFTMAPVVYVGLAVSSHVTGVNATATFDNVTITTSAPPPPSPSPSPSPNVTPSVTMTGPAEGATFTAPAAIVLTASAADSDGTIAAVDFFAGATKLGTDTTEPYTFNWASVPAGTYSLTAVAIDNAAGTTTSTPVSITVSAPPPPPPVTTALPPGWSSLDVGTTGAIGTASFTNGVYSVRGAGADVWGTADAFQYAYRALDGDGSIVARVSSIEAIHAWTKAGVMIRSSLSPSAAQAFMLVASSPVKGVPYQRRLADGNTTISSPGSPSTAPRWVKLTRVGSTIAGYESADGVTWTQVGSSTFVMGPVVYVGLAVSSHVTGALATATFDSVVIQPN